MLAIKLIHGKINSGMTYRQKTYAIKIKHTWHYLLTCWVGSNRGKTKERIFASFGLLTLKVYSQVGVSKNEDH